MKSHSQCQATSKKENGADLFEEMMHEIKAF